MMKAALVLTLVYLLHCEGAVVVQSEEVVLNDRPIIGILSQEQSFYLHTKYPEENYTSYIAASYVKDVESAGARVVPIMIGRDRSYYENIMSKINGVLLPGGATFFNQSNGYADAGQHIYEIAQKLNDQGDYFPIFGTCLGFELLVILASGRGKVENRIRCYSYGNLPLAFTNDFRSSKMFKNAPEDVIQLLANEDITVNVHQFCIVDENLKKYNLTKSWRATSYSNDYFGIKFIASFENKKYPFYGVQFHPEKVAYEWKLSKNHPHTAEAVKANRYFMDFFVSECRKNFHTFTDVAEENQYLIYNYKPYFTGVLGSAFLQCYLFEPRGAVSNNINPLIGQRYQPNQSDD
ncbi:gamma-glutamyl hydrolase-like isoform X2 [Epargyreus clarus]